MSVKTRKNASRLASAVRPEIEKLESRQLLAGDPLAYQNVVQTLPYVLDFTSAQPGVYDKTGTQGTGFTLIQPNKNGTQYQPALINLNTAAGELDLTTQGTTTSGSNYGTDNTMVNGLETRFDATTAGFNITATIKGPLSQIDANYDSAGVFFGPNQDNYVKLSAGFDSANGGQMLQFTDEQNGTTHSVNIYQSIGSFANIQTLSLRLTGNAGNNTVTASYSVNGGSFVNIAGTVTLTGTVASAFFTPSSTAGIMAINKNATPMTVAFDGFRIDAGASVANRPSVRYTSPASSATGVSVNAPIEADLNLPNSAINAQTINSSTVMLYRSSDQSPVSAIVNTSGGGDSIILTPTSALAANTQYTFSITAGVQDTTGVSMVPFQISFTTGAAATQVNPSIQFSQTNLATATGAAFTCVKVGPDGKLYASTEDGRIFRWAINTDGTLGTPQIITSLQQFNGGKRLVTGFAFDPAATASNPMIWVSNSYYALSGATTGVDFTGAITLMSGPNLATVQNAVTNLPRSVADHSTEQPIFGPGPIAGHKYLYFAQASNTAFGAPDKTWGMRPEHLLTAAILRLDTSAINVAAGPLNVLTPDVGGTYNPYAPGAPLIIYATGVRNSFSMIFTSDGKLLAPNNGSSAGGNAPAYNASDPNQINGNRIDTGQPYSGPNVPGLTNIQQTERDYLFNIVQNGYYGHPNAYRGEYVLNGGNPSTGGVANQIFTAYPSGTNPDANYRGAAWDFGPHASADGIIEYQDKTFGGQMQGVLLVTEYSAGSDIVALFRDSSGNVISQVRGIAGFSNLNNPVSLVQNPLNGNIYVSELGGQRIVLLTPVVPAPKVSSDKSVVVLSGISKGYTGAATSPAASIVITNTGTTPLNFGAGAFSIGNDPSAPSADAAAFLITNSASLPSTLAAGASMTIKVNYTAGKVGAQYARLQITSNDPKGPFYIALRGIGTTGNGGANEPSLPAILRAYNIPTITGDGVNDANMNQTFYPASPDVSSQEVSMQRLQKAGTGPVSIQILASFNAAGTAGTALARFGYYTPGSGAALDKDELFLLAQADAQTTNPTPIGATKFDPGASPFGLYTIFPHFLDNGKSRISYSEDALNTWDANVPRKVRFFPMKNADGSVVPDAYIFAMEDNNIPFGAIQPYDSNDIVGIIRNVKPAASGPVMGVQLNQTAPGSSTLLFNKVQKVNPIVADVVHDTNTITINNTGDQPLVLGALTLSDTKNWALVNAPAAGTSIAAKSSLTLTVKFIATTVPTHTDNQTNDTASASLVSVTAAGGVWKGTLTITSNDAVNPSRKVNLAGYWQYETEHENEPSINTVSRLMLGYSTDITGNTSTQVTQFTNNGNTVVTYGAEVNPSTNQGLFLAADPSQPVSLLELAAYHQQYVTVVAKQGTVGEALAAMSEVGNTVTVTTAAPNNFKTGTQVTISGDLNGYNGTYTILSTPTANTFTFNSPVTDLPDYAAAPTQPQSGWYVPGGKTKYLFKDQVNNGQAVFPLLTNASTSTVVTSFTPTGAFGLNLDGQRSQDSANSGNLAYNTSGHGLRFWPIVDSAGNNVPNTFLIGLDYRAYATPNSDYQDLMAIVTNVTFQAMPATPFNVHATADAAGVALQWAGGVNSASYNVYRSTSVNGTFTKLNSSAITSPSFLDTQAPDGVTSYYRIAAVNSSGVESIKATVTGAALPAAPATLTAATQSASSIKLTWSAVGGATRYRVERQVLGSGNWAEVGTSNTATFTDTGLLGSTNYVYQIRAENGSGFSPYSPVATASTTSGVAPGTPTNLQAALNGSNQVTLSWTAPSGSVTAYHVERKLQGDTVFVEIASSVSATSFTDTTATPGNTYIYRVRAENAGTLGAYSSSVTKTVGTAPPTGLQASVISQTEIDLSWVAATGTVTLYHVERQDPVTSAWSEIGTSSGVSYKDMTAQVGKTYNYRVRSENSGSFSAYTTPVQATTPSGAPAAPASVTAVANSSTQVSLTWSAVSSASSYIIQRRITGTASWTTLSGAYTNGVSFTDDTAQANTNYTYQVAAQNVAGVGGFTQAQVTTTQSTYSSADIASTPAGSTVVNSDGSSYDVTAGGTDIGSTAADGFRFVYRQITGNFDAMVQVQSLTNTFNTAKAGLMARVSLDEGSAMVFDGATAASSFRWLYRTVANATASFNSVGSNVAYPNAWVRLSRIGNVFTGYYSTDGQTWLTGGSITLTLPQSLYVGMAVTSHNTSAVTTAQFRNLNVLTPPAAPTATASAGSSSTITVNWNAVPNATSYNILRYNPASSTYASIATGVKTTTYQDTALSANTTYQYQVIAVNSAGSSPASNVSSATTQANSGTNAPLAPTGMTGSSPSPTRINIDWNPSSGATSYAVMRSVDSGVTWTTVLPSTTNTAYSDYNVASGTTYWYQVTATNSGGTSPGSAVLKVRSQSVFDFADIGTTTSSQTSILVNAKSYDVTAGGTGIYNTADSFTFVYTPVTGNFDISAQVTSLTGGASGTYPQAGLMVRSTLDASSPEVAITASPVGGYRFKYRAASGNATTQTQTNGINATFPNAWLRLQRVGNIFTTYYCTDGVNWIKLGSVTLSTISATSPVYIGMAVASNTEAATATASFRNLTGA